MAKGIIFSIVDETDTAFWLCTVVLLHVEVDSVTAYFPSKQLLLFAFARQYHASLANSQDRLDQCWLSVSPPSATLV